jgi:Ankyrin repeats (many copies)
MKKAEPPSIANTWCCAAVINNVVPISGPHCPFCYDHTAPTLCSSVPVPVLKLLLAAGAVVHFTSTHGNTCLHAAAAYGHAVLVLCLLIKAGADLHAVNSNGKTAAEVEHDRGNQLIEQLLNCAAQH